MSLQIITGHPALEDEAVCLDALGTSWSGKLVSYSPLLIPPAPPLPPDGFPKATWKRSGQDADSGCGSFAESFYFDELPGCGVSDSEFRESFAVTSRASSGRSSWCEGLEMATESSRAAIPEPPPLPPVQFFIPRFAFPPAAATAAVRRSPDLDIAPLPPLRLRRNVSFDSDLSDIYGSFPRLAAVAASDGESDFQTVPGTCIICYDSGPAFLKLSCCGEITCQPCLATMIRTRLGDGLIEFPCPNPECSEPVSRAEALRHLDADERARYEQLRVNAEDDGTRKTCPHCSHITEHQLPRVRLGRQLREEEVKITCENCRIEWCFHCHAPWHTGLTCKAFIRGNKQFREWTRGQSNGIANCQKCPTCRVFIQRSTGCDHMTCNRCKTHFCYKCGGRFVEIPGFGDHYQRTSIFGCKYNYLQNEPIRRKTLRGGYFGAKLAMLTGYPVLFVGGVAVLALVGAVALPIYGGYRYYKFKKNTRRIRRRGH